MTPALVGQLANNELLVIPTPVNVVRMNSAGLAAVVINEVMPLGDSTVSKGAWIELRNTTHEPVDLTGMVLTSTATQTSWQFPSGVVIASHEVLVVGESTDPAENGDTPVDLAWSGLTFDTSSGDTLQLTAVTTLSQITWRGADVAPGRSIQSDRAIGTNGLPLPCDTTRPYSPTGAMGTPGAENDTCFDYSLSKIPVAFEDITATGTPLFVPLVEMDKLNASSI